jgi:hypothetical protein
VLLVLVAAMATVSFTTSSASSRGGLLRSSALSTATTSKPAGSRRIAPAIKKQAHLAAKQGKNGGAGSAELNIARKGHTASKLSNGRVIIVGGENDGGPVQASEVYDPESHAFSLSAKLSTARAGHTASKLEDGRILIVGGHNQNGGLKSSELFDPGVNEFSRGPSLSRARSGHTATVLADGRLLIVGGDAGGTAEILDPGTMKFKRLDSRLGVPRSSHSAILLKSGRVLIAGGLSPDGVELRSGEVFDPVSLEFGATRNSMFGARTRPTLHELPDGKVQVIGGDDERSMEMFNAEGQYFTARARLVSESDSESNISEVLRSSGRAALIDNRGASIPTESASGLRALRSPVVDNLLVRGDALADLLDRSDHTITEIPETGKALITGGKSSRGMALMSSTTTQSSSATVTTDKTDYQPGDIVHMSGTNWQPGETVQLTLHRDNGTPDEILTAPVEPDGTFQNSELLIVDSDIGVTFLLNALGLSSGYTAQTTFTDAINIGSFAANCSTPTETFTSGTTVCAKATGLGSGASGKIEWWAPGAVTATRTTTFTNENGSFSDLFAPTICGTWTLKVFSPAATEQDTDTFVVTSCGTAPTFTACPSNITQNTDPGVCTAAVAFTVSANGSPAPTISCTASGATTGTVSSGSTFNKGITSVVCTATNGVSPDATCSFTVTVNDTQNPTITCPSSVTQNNDPGQCSAVVNYPNATATDNCPGVGTPSCTPPSGSAFAVGSTTVTCTVSDANGNSNSCSFTVTVNDTQNPSITCPSPVTANNDAGQCSAVVNYPNATATDNCPGVGTPSCTPPPGTAFVVGTTTVTCTVSDAHGNSNSCSFSVTVNDTENPSITCPSAVTQNNDPNQCSAVVNYPNATATDNCSGVGTPNCTPASGTTFAVGVTTVTCTVSDAHGNSNSCSFTVTVNDTQNPSITCPSPVTKNNDANLCSAVVNYSNATATDNCPGVGSPSCAPASGSPFPVGTTTVTCTVSDAHGNSNSCSFTVTVNDTQNPSITCPSPVIKNNDPGQCSAVVNYPNATAADNCPGVGTPSCTPPSGSTFAVGATTVNCTVSDAHGNSNSCSFTVTVKDAEAPTCVVPSSIVTPCTTSSGGAVVNYTASTTDNCGVASITCIPPSGSTFGPGTTTVTCTATDASTDSPNSTCSFPVTVGYNFNGFFQPVDNDDYNLVKAGQSVPMKFQLTCGGNFISNLSAVVSVQSVQVICDGGVDGDPIPADDSGASGLHYDFTANQFIYSWKTDKSWANKCRKFILTLNDGSVHCAYFQFKK